MNRYKKTGLKGYEDTTEFRNFLSDTADIHEKIVGFIPEKYDQKTLATILDYYKDLKITLKKPQVLEHYVFWLISMYDMEYKNHISSEEKAKFLDSLDKSVDTGLLRFLVTYSQFSFTSGNILKSYFE